jgi:hypothetical protein
LPNWTDVWVEVAVEVTLVVADEDIDVVAVLLTEEVAVVVNVDDPVLLIEVVAVEDWVVLAELLAVLLCDVVADDE